ncbi:unnamed protein product [Ilex paraguariensis]|uniref:Uncharacterized protein n=1 Tax=Ilex paraguariensis TaxID=185542 RepID=A0ABC8S798_9AQUA
MFPQRLSLGSLFLWVEDFRRKNKDGVVDDCNLLGLGFRGYLYTWWNGSALPCSTKARLDRVWVSSSWLAKFPESSVTHLPAVD